MDVFSLRIYSSHVKTASMWVRPLSVILLPKAFPSVDILHHDEDMTVFLCIWCFLDTYIITSLLSRRKYGMTV